MASTAAGKQRIPKVAKVSPGELCAGPACHPLDTSITGDRSGLSARLIFTFSVGSNLYWRTGQGMVMGEGSSDTITQALV